MLIALAVVVAQAGSASKHLNFTIEAASPRFSLSVEVAPSKESTDDPVIGPATVTVLSRGTKKPVQTIKLPSIAVFKNQKSISIAAPGKTPSQYDTSYTFIFQDFNFDGKQDLAICNGLNGSYGLPSYDVFLWSANQNRFVKDQMLTSLASEHLGLFAVDSKKKEFVVFDKSGAAWHKSSFYQWFGGKPTLYKEEVDDATGNEDVVTTKTLIGKKWHTKVKKMAKQQ